MAFRLKRWRMLSKRASTILPEAPKRRVRFEEEISFIPSIKRDIVRTVGFFLREISDKETPYQMTICLSDYSLGRLGYYDLSYKSLDVAKKQYDEIIEAVKSVREIVEYNMLPCADMEKMCRQTIDAVLDKATIFDSTYHGKYRGRNAA